jgi:cation transport regulator
MPYTEIANLPESTNKLPEHAKHIYMAAFNSAHEQYGEEARAHATAWAAVKKKYKKNESGKWTKKAPRKKEGSLAVILSYLDKKTNSNS